MFRTVSVSTLVSALLLIPTPQKDLRIDDLQQKSKLIQVQFQYVYPNVFVATTGKIMRSRTPIVGVDVHNHTLYVVTYRGAYRYLLPPDDDLKLVFRTPYGYTIGENPCLDENRHPYYPLYKPRPALDDFHNGVVWDFCGIVSYDMQRKRYGIVGTYINPAKDSDPNSWHLRLKRRSAWKRGHDFFDLCLVQLTLKGFGKEEKEAKVVWYYFKGKKRGTFEEKGPIDVKEFAK